MTRRRAAAEQAGRPRALRTDVTRLFEPITLRGLTIPNRVWLAPMCQYSAVDGVPDDWHLVHLGARAAGGFGLVLTEATAVAPDGRISPQDTGRKASVYRPWSPDQGSVPVPDGGWVTSGPSASAHPGLAAPVALSREDVAAIPGLFAAAARRAHAAGFDVVELHA